MALARGLILLAAPVDGEATPEFAPEPLRSDAADNVLGPRGTVKFCRFVDELSGSA